MIWWVIGGVVVIIIVAVVFIAKGKAKRSDNPDVLELFPALRGAGGQPISPKDEATLRQNLMVKLQHQEDKVNAAIEFERHRDPAASTGQLMQAAIERWERENR
jgi:hypothetical protein